MAAFARADATALCRRLSGAGASGTGRRASPTSPPRVSRVARAMFDPGRRSGTATRTTSPPSAPPRGLAFTADPSRVDAAAAAALMGRPDDPALVAKLRAAFDSPEGVVVAAFARVDDDRDLDPARDRDRERPAGRDDDPGDALRGVFLMGFDMLAGDGNVDGKTLVGFARAATDAAMVATVDDVVVHEAHRGRGVGRKLVRRLADELRHERYTTSARARPRVARTSSPPADSDRTPRARSSWPSRAPATPRTTTSSAATRRDTSSAAERESDERSSRTWPGRTKRRRRKRAGGNGDEREGERETEREMREARESPGGGERTRREGEKVGGRWAVTS